MKSKSSTKQKKEEQITLSVIVPLYNGAKWILRLLESVDKQTFKPSMEVIIQDDYSTDDGVELVKSSKYMKSLNIKFFTNKQREIHCPGNTRLDGMNNAKGIWITFIDQDDRYELNAFEEIFKCIEYNKEENFVVSNFREVVPETGELVKEFNQTDITWMHGKFYKRTFLDKYGIKFKENLNSDEDLYFNQTVFSIVTVNNLKYSILNEYTYLWSFNLESESRRADAEVYIDRNYANYFIAGAEPWLNQLDAHPELADKLFNRACFVLLYGYFYYQSLYFRRGYVHHRVNRDHFENFLNKIKAMFGATNQDVIDAVYSDIKSYNKVRSDVINKSWLPVIEYESFKTFVERF